MIDPNAYLAHSAPKGRSSGQLFAEHVQGVVEDATANAAAVLRHAAAPPDGFLHAVRMGAYFHDLGKLDPDIQKAFRQGRSASLTWDHIDAGCAHLVASGNRPGAFLVRAHHAPGLPRYQDHFNRDDLGAKLRGRRTDLELPNEKQVARTDGKLDGYLSLHAALLGKIEVPPVKEFHGLALRLALSCLVDADHTDTAAFDRGEPLPDPPAPRWPERLASLEAYVARKSTEAKGDPARNRLRSDFFNACRASPVDAPIVACEGSVGIGKTTGIAAYLLQVASRKELRRLILVAPFTNIVSQTAAVLREALTLPGEDPDDVVIEHHHRADFSARASRDLAASWQAPIIVTTAVQFFETLAACDPGSLRKLHRVPGSAICIDEAHAALPVALWWQNWAWVRELAEKWGCRFVLASGSLARFWEKKEVVEEVCTTIPQLMPDTLAHLANAAERRRVRFVQAGDLSSVKALVDRVGNEPGPRLVILNTVQSAAVVARAMQQAGLDTLHLSTALCPRDRAVSLDKVKGRLDMGIEEWVLVATSCVEAGVDISFRTGFRERFSTSSLLQVAGRVNRHGEFNAVGGGHVVDFAIPAGDGILRHPAAAGSAPVLRKLLCRGSFDQIDRLPADLVTQAMEQELRENPTTLKGSADALVKAERSYDYPAVAQYGRVIAADTRLVVVDKELLGKLENFEKVNFRDLLDGSVQMWANKIFLNRLQEIRTRPGIYQWHYAYDPEIFGYMKGVLDHLDIEMTGACFL
ncbi:CRISPR-associated helicase/endonuclease Cas3 [Oleisolibacter albus]|uniref:CRISPR-associated helicase/endonuclease Cas3 n=1 Tax=Oleisolibacter albus TaxID=2171757 RepID=UPI0012D731B2|nr:CRISPR-associated protein [Oleisolibacter albus]